MPLFYTLPPNTIPYPYILINANNPAINYVITNHRYIDSIIIDSGVEIFRDKNVKDYPPNHFERLVKLYKRVKQYVSDAKIYVTVPDYPDDYHPRALWLSNDKTNIERTLDNILIALNNYPEVNWLIPVQGHYRKPSSVVYALELYQKHDIPLDDYIAVANLCVEERTKIIVETIMFVNSWLFSNGYYNTRIHVFGPDVRSINNIHKYIYSWDSMAWTRPRTPNGYSPKTMQERIYLFLTWIHKYSDIIDIPYLPKTMRKKNGGNNV